MTKFWKLLANLQCNYYVDKRMSIEHIMKQNFPGNYRVVAQYSEWQGYTKYEVVFDSPEDETFCSLKYS